MTLEVLRIDVRDAMFASVARLRYAVYAEEEGQDLPGMDHGRRTLADALDAASLVFAAVDDGVVTGTFRLTPMTALPAGDAARAVPAAARWPVPEARQLWAGRLMVDPAHRGGPACAGLFAAGYRAALARGAELVFASCSPRNVALYESVGCRQVAPLASDPTYGVDVPLALVVRDVAHLARVRSPLGPMARATPPNDALAAAAAGIARPWGGPLSVAMKPAEDRERLQRELAALPGSPFAGLAPAERQRALRSATVLEVPKGLQVVTAGCACTETFLVLDGAVTVGGRTATRGAAFNATALLGRTPARAPATAVAATPARLLALGAESFANLWSTRPALARSIGAGLRRLVPAG